jgi:prepilin-type N-terminal cleavage/methylation domain-containing protein
MNKAIRNHISDDRSGSSEKGMTIIELLVSMTVGCILMTAAWSFFSTQTSNFDQNRQTAEMQQELRWSMQYVTDHLRLAGNAVPSTSGWQVIEIKDDTGGNSDSLTVIGSFASVIALTTENMASLAANVKPDSIQKFEQGDLVVISDGTFQELFLVTQITGGRLCHATSLPWNNDANLDHQYSTGSTLTAIDQFNFYSKTDASGHRNLMVKTQAYPEQILGGDIDRFQIRFKMKSGSWQTTIAASEVYDIRQIEITMRARSSRPLRNYRDPVYGDSYKRLELKSIVIPRNIVIV